jgi:hypothetical protein
MKLAISPYWSVRKPAGSSLEQSISGARHLASMPGVDVIAPQEGRGTGKAACFWKHEAEMPIADVDPNLGRYSNVDGNETFASQFWASTHELYAGARIEVDDVNANMNMKTNVHNAHKSHGWDVELWMNLEAFEATNLSSPCNSEGSGRDRTNKTRVDRSLVFGAGAVDKVISFMWDPYFTCHCHGFNATLHEEIIDDEKRPIIVHAHMLSVSDVQTETETETGTNPNTSTASNSSTCRIVARGSHLCNEHAQVTVSWLLSPKGHRQHATISPTRCSAGQAGASLRLHGFDTIEIALPSSCNVLVRPSYLELKACTTSATGGYCATSPYYLELGLS